MNATDISGKHHNSGLMFVLIVQLAMLGTIGLDVIGLKIPLIRQIIGFIYLTFVPGFLILNLLRVRNLDIWETILFSVGLSISALMVIGLFLNSTYPALQQPISTLPIVIVLTTVTLFLTSIAYLQHSFSDISFKAALRSGIRAHFLLLSMILILPLTILGIYLVDFYDNSSLLLVIIGAMALVVALVSFTRFRRTFSKIWPVLLVIFSISLLYQRSLVPLTLSGFEDVHFECYFQRLVVINARWDPAFANPRATYNTMLSDTLVPAIYSILLNLDSVWVIKVIYPLFFMLVPLALYYCYSKQIGKYAAFLSAFFFISLYVFFDEMIWLTRQQMAELFLVLLITLMMKKNIEGHKKVILSAFFFFSLAVSHYALSYIFLFLIFLGALLIRVTKNRASSEFTLLRMDSVALFSAIALGWYLFVGNGITLDALVGVPNHVFSSISQLFQSAAMDPNVLRGLGATPMSSLQREVTRIFFYITQFFIVFGVVELAISRKFRNRFNKEYAMLAFSAMGLLLLSIILPNFAVQLSMTRIYQISLIFLSPFCILGGKDFFVKLLKLRPQVSAALLIIVVLVPYFLFNTGFISAITRDNPPSSVTLDLKRFKESNDKLVLGIFYTQQYIPEQDVASVRWLSDFRDPTIRIYTDIDSILWSYGMIDNSYRFSNASEITVNTYVHLIYLNVVKGILLGYSQGMSGSPFVVNIPEDLFDARDRIYSNGACVIYKDR